MATETVTNIGGGNVHKYSSSGTGALVDTTAAIDQGAGFESVSIHLGSAPSSQENLTVTLDANAGAAYDTVLFTGSMGGITNLLVDEADFNVTLQRGDALDVAWDNTDGVTWGMEITLVEGVF
jgi:hypothetical protein